MLIRRFLVLPTLMAALALSCTTDTAPAGDAALADVPLQGDAGEPENDVISGPDGDDDTVEPDDVVEEDDTAVENDVIPGDDGADSSGDDGLFSEEVEGPSDGSDAGGSDGTDDTLEPGDTDATDSTEPPPSDPVLIISSAPSGLVLEGHIYRYAPKTAVAGEVLWTVVDGPADAIVTDSGVLEWMPDAADSGSVAFTLKGVHDALEAEQTWTVEVRGVAPVAAADIGAAGGTLAVFGTSEGLQGTTITIPPGAVAGDVAITAGTFDAPVTLPAFLDATTIPALVLGPQGTKFSAPVRIQVPFDSSAAAESLQVVALDEATGVWESLPILAIDLENHLATVETTHFTAFIAAPVKYPAQVVAARSLGGAPQKSWLTTIGAKVKLDVVNRNAVINLPADVSGGNVRSIITAPGFQGSLRAMVGSATRSVPGFGGGCTDYQWLVATAYVVEGQAYTTVTLPSGELLSTTVYDLLTEWNELEDLLRGHGFAVPVVEQFGSPGAAAPPEGSGRRCAYGYLQYYAGDARTVPLASLPPTGGYWFGYEDVPPAAQPVPFVTLGNPTDTDADGALDPWDFAAAPSQAWDIVPTPASGLADGVVGQTVTLECSPNPDPGGVIVTWESNVPTDVITQVDGYTLVHLVATTPGAHHVTCTAMDGVVTTSQTFSVNVVEPDRTAERRITAAEVFDGA